MNSNESLIFSLYDIGAVQFGEFTLKSGQTSSVYLNLRKIISYPKLLQTIAHKMWVESQTWEFERICGVPYTALPIATCISVAHDIPMVMRRKEQKNYGMKQMIEGEYHSGESCLIIEDVITTGSSIAETAVDLQNAGLKTPYAVVLIDREQGGREDLINTYHFKVKSILTLSDVLLTLLSSNKLNAAEQDAIQHFLAARAI